MGLVLDQPSTCTDVERPVQRIASGQTGGGSSSGPPRDAYGREITTTGACACDYDDHAGGDDDVDSDTV